MVTIVKQARFSIWRFREIYEFPVPLQHGKPSIKKILAFYRQRPLSNVVVNEESLQFRRGSILATIFNPNERRVKQRVLVQIAGSVVRCEYICQAPLVHLQIPPSQLYKEVQALEAILTNSSIEKRKPFGSPIYRLIYWF